MTCATTEPVGARYPNVLQLSSTSSECLISTFVDTVNLAVKSQKLADHWQEGALNVVTRHHGISEQPVSNMLEKSVKKILQEFVNRFIVRRILSLSGFDS